MQALKEKCPKCGYQLYGDVYSSNESDIFAIIYCLGCAHEVEVRDEYSNISKVVIVVDHKCWHYNVIDPTHNENCPNCSHWGWTRCKDEKLLMNRINETENMMRHDGYRREHGAVRQTRRG